MTVTTPTTPPPPAAGSTPSSASHAAVEATVGAASTPSRLRLWSLMILVGVILSAVSGFLAARALTASSDRAETSTAPVLVATQDVFASIAEADAASAAVFLSGADEDREQRRLYEDALVRSTAQLEEVSRLVGDDDEAHDAIKSIAADLTTYAGLVESARVANQNGLPGASTTLLEAIDTVQRGIVPQVESLTSRAQLRLDEDVDDGGTEVLIAVVIMAVTLVLLLAGQNQLQRRTRRLLNPPLVLATLLLVVAGAWLLSSWLRQQDDLDVARTGGYDSIALTADIQTSAFRYKTLESLALLGAGDEAEQVALATDLSAIDIDADTVAAARDGRAAGDGLLLQANRAADSTREQAATSELLVRWDRYLRTSQDIGLALDADERDEAVALAIGAGNSDFNGFNTAVESVLSDNRSQFLDGIAAARDRLDWLQLIMIVLPALAALTTLWGYQIRINEYRR